MKLVTLLFIIFLFKSGISQSISLNPSIGTNYVIPKISGANNDGGKLGLVAGLLINIKLKENLLLESGLMYSKELISIRRGFVYPPNFPFQDAPQVQEKVSFNNLKIPVSIMFKGKKDLPFFWSFGLLIKYNIGSQREGVVTNRPEYYSDDFKIFTENGKNLGFGGIISVGKELQMARQKFKFRFNYDTDIGKKLYPTNFELESHQYFSFQSHTFSVLVSYVLQ